MVKNMIQDTYLEKIEKDDLILQIINVMQREKRKLTLNEIMNKGSFPHKKERTIRRHLEYLAKHNIVEIKKGANNWTGFCYSLRNIPDELIKKSMLKNHTHMLEEMSKSKDVYWKSNLGVTIYALTLPEIIEQSNFEKEFNNVMDEYSALTTKLFLLQHEAFQQIIGKKIKEVLSSSYSKIDKYLFILCLFYMGATDKIEVNESRDSFLIPFKWFEPDKHPYTLKLDMNLINIFHNNFFTDKSTEETWNTLNNHSLDKEICRDLDYLNYLHILLLSLKDSLTVICQPDMEKTKSLIKKISEKKLIDDESFKKHMNGVDDYNKKFLNDLSDQSKKSGRKSQIFRRGKMSNIISEYIDFYKKRYEI